MAVHKQSRDAQGDRPQIGYTAGSSIKVNPAGLRILRFLKTDDFPDILSVLSHFVHSLYFRRLQSAFKNGDFIDNSIEIKRIVGSPIRSNPQISSHGVLLMPPGTGIQKLPIAVETDRLVIVSDGNHHPVRRRLEGAAENMIRPVIRPFFSGYVETVLRIRKR
jgi:hypothetical protein